MHAHSAARLVATVAAAAAISACRGGDEPPAPGDDIVAIAIDDGSAEAAQTEDPPDTTTPPPGAPTPTTAPRPQPPEGSGALPEGSFRMLPRLEPGDVFARTAALTTESELLLDDGEHVSRAWLRSDVELAWRLEVLDSSPWSLRRFRASFERVVVDGQAGVDSASDVLGERGPMPGETWTCDLDGADIWRCVDEAQQERSLPAWLPVQLVQLTPGEPVSAGSRWTRRTGTAPIVGLGPEGRATVRVTLGAPWRSEHGRFVEASLAIEGETRVDTFDRPGLLTVEGSGALTWDLPASYASAYDVRWTARGEGVHIDGAQRWTWRRTMRHALRTTSQRLP